jgi:hypothetical protein
MKRLTIRLLDVICGRVNQYAQQVIVHCLQRFRVRSNLLPSLSCVRRSS